ncbi:MAG: D-arabinono-1,4-lactone oxidase [Vicinamibacteria bacterium]
MTDWSNWSGSVRCRPRVVVKPSTLEDVVTAIRRAATDGRGVRVAGSGHSFTPLVATDGALLSLERVTGIEGVDSERSEAMVLGGTRLKALGEALFDRGLAMENLGDIDAQALAGALCTGTHGTGRGLGTLSTQIAAMTLVTANGEIIDCASGREPDLFQAARVSLGALGVLWSIRLRVVPTFRLRYVRKSMDLEECLGSLRELGAHRHFELYWFPHTRRVDTKAMDPSDAPPTPDGFGRFLNDVVLENGAFWALSEACRAVPHLTAPASRLCARLVSEGTRVGDSHRVFATPRLVRFQEMEYALPAESGPDCLREIRRYVEDKGVPVHFPVEFRLVKGDDIWLSPAYGRDSAYIAVHQYRGMPYRDYFEGVEAIFRNHRGRPHWGKIHTRTAAELAPLYPMWEPFHEVRRRVDPRGLFLNDYLGSLFGLTPGSGSG